MKGWELILFFILILILPTFLYPWGFTQRLTWTNNPSAYPHIFIDSNDDIHIVWVEYFSGSGEIFYKRTSDNGSTWMPPNRLTWNSGNSREPFFIKRLGQFNLVWVDDSTGNDEIYYKNSTDGGLTWSTTQRITWNNGDSRTPTITADFAFGVHIIWSDNTPGNEEIFYKRSTDSGATWLPPLRLTWNTGSSQYPFIMAVLNELHVVWSDFLSGNWDVCYKQSLNTGGTWSSLKRLTYNPGNSWKPCMTVTDNKYIHIVWYDGSPGNDEIYFKRSNDNGKTWDPIQRLTWNFGYSRHPKINCDAAGNLLLVWFDSSFGNEEILHNESIDNGANWIGISRLTWNSSLSSQPDIASDSYYGKYVVWQDNGPSNWEIFLKSHHYLIPANRK